MLVHKLVNLEPIEVEVDVSIEDLFQEVLSQDEPESVRLALRLVNAVAPCLKVIPAARIAEMSPGTRKVIREFLAEQCKRYEEAAYLKELKEGAP